MGNNIIYVDKTMSLIYLQLNTAVNSRKTTMLVNIGCVTLQKLE